MMNLSSTPTEGTPARVNASTDGTYQTDLPFVLTPLEAAKAARVSRDLIYDLCRQNAIPHRRLGWEIRIPRDPFLRWLEGHSIPDKQEGLA